jgi:hypothetical protein
MMSELVLPSFHPYEPDPSDPLALDAVFDYYSDSEPSEDEIVVHVSLQSSGPVLLSNHPVQTHQLPQAPPYDGDLQDHESSQPRIDSSRENSESVRLSPSEGLGPSRPQWEHFDVPD